MGRCIKLAPEETMFSERERGDKSVHELGMSPKPMLT